MVRGLKKILFGALLLTAGTSLHAFTMLGPGGAVGGGNAAVAWQDQSIGYNSQGFQGGGFVQGNEIGGPLNLGEEYRWNIPEITYAFDESFLNYFGSNGVDAVKASIAVFNDLPRMSTTSSDLTEFPLSSQQINFQAAALNLIDLKSTTMHLILERLGLADPLHYMWAIRSSTTVNNNINWQVIQRNFDPVTFEPSAFVNSASYTYEIRNFSVGGTGTGFDDAVEIPVDVTAFDSVPIASGLPNAGGYFIGLTRDDIGGLRYLYRPENLNVEQLPPGTEILLTNETITFLDTFDLATFLRETQNTTNSLAQVQALFPQASIVGVTNITLTRTNVDSIRTFFTNFPQSPTPVFVTNTTTVELTNFFYEVNNLQTNALFSDNLVVSQKVQVTIATNVAPRSLETNFVDRAESISNFVNGEVFFVPTNLFNFTLLDVASTNVISNVVQTNIVIGDLFAYTNQQGGEVRLDSIDLLSFATNTVGTTNDPAAIQALFPGIEILRTNIRQGHIELVSLVDNVIVTNNVFTNIYDYAFHNVFTNSATTTTWVTNRLVEIAVNPTGGIDGRPLLTNVLLQTTLTAGGSAAAAAQADLDPLGSHNDLLFTSKFLGSFFNGVELRFIDDGTLTGNVAEASYDATARLLTVNIDNESSDANSVVSALADPTAAGGSVGTTSSAYMSFGLPNSDLKFEALAGGSAGNGLNVQFRTPFEITEPAPGTLKFKLQSQDAGLVDVDAAAPVYATYDAVSNTILVYVRGGVVTANQVVSHLKTAIVNGLPAFQAAYAVSLDTAGNPANNGTDVITLSLPQFAADRATTGGFDGLKAQAALISTGDNNDLLFEAVAGGPTGDGLRVELRDLGRGNIAGPTYDAVNNILSIDFTSGVTDANALIAAIAADVSADMLAFKALYTTTLNTSTEPANDGTGVLSFVPFTAALDLVEETDNSGVGKLGANVNISILEELAGGEAYIVPTNLLGFEIVNTVFTNTSNTTSIIVTNSTFLHTNTSELLSVTNIDLCEFRRLVETNNPSQLLQIFPDLVITRTNVTPGLMISNTITGVATNLTPYQPALTIPSNVLITNTSTNVFPFFDMEFGNVITNFTHPLQTVVLLETNVVQNPYSPAGVTNLITNVTTRTMTVPGPCGSVMIIPTNTTPRIFDYQIVSTNLVTVTAITNTIFSVPISNAFGGVFSNTLSQVTYSTNYFFNAYPIEFRDPSEIGTNGFGLRRETVRPVTTHVYGAYPIELTNAPGLPRDIIVSQEEFITFATNRTFKVREVALQAAGANELSLRRGIDKIQFTDVTTNFNSRLGQGPNDFIPVTNLFETLVVTNSQETTQWVRRIVTQPDFLFTARDLGANTFTDRSPGNWQDNNDINGVELLAGPGVMINQVVITFTTLQPSHINSGPFALKQGDAEPYFRWGVFRGDGAPPKLFPEGVTIKDIENQALTP